MDGGRINRDGVFRPLVDDRSTGGAVEVAWLPDGQVATRRTIPEAARESMLATTAAMRDANPRGSVLGHTQRHRVPLASIPTPEYWRLLRLYGRPSQNPKAWLRWLDDHGHLRTSGYRS